MACYGQEEKENPEEKEEYLRRSYCSRCTGWVAPLCTCSKVKGASSSSGLAEGVGLYVAPPASSPFSHSSRPSAQHRSTVGGGSGGDATLLAREQRGTLLVDGGRRLVQVRLGASPEMQDGR